MTDGQTISPTIQFTKITHIIVTNYIHAADFVLRNEEFLRYLMNSPGTRRFITVFTRAHHVPLF